MSIDPLDGLLKQALYEQSQRKVKARPDDRTSKIRESFRAVYEKPENWERRRGIALIHRDDQGQTTLLGNFTEYVHIKKPDARKLVREAEPMLVSTEEFVSGPYWLKDRPKLEIDDHAQKWQTRTTVMNIRLEELKLLAEAVLVRVHLLDNWIARVELKEQTAFHCPVNSQILYLPAGVDILDGLDIESKLELRKEMGV